MVEISEMSLPQTEDAQMLRSRYADFHLLLYIAKVRGRSSAIGHRGFNPLVHETEAECNVA